MKQISNREITQLTSAAAAAGGIGIPAASPFRTALWKGWPELLPADLAAVEESKAERRAAERKAGRVPADTPELWGICNTATWAVRAARAGGCSREDVLAAVLAGWPAVFTVTAPEEVHEDNVEPEGLDDDEDEEEDDWDEGDEEEEKEEDEEAERNDDDEEEDEEDEYS